MRKVFLTGKRLRIKNQSDARFDAAEKHLRARGLIVVNPHKLCSEIHIDAHPSTFMKRCIAEIPSMDAVFVIDGWETCRESLADVETAFNLNIPVLEISTMKELELTYKAFPIHKGVILNIH